MWNCVEEADDQNGGGISEWTVGKGKDSFFFWQRVYIIDVSTDSLSAER